MSKQTLNENYLLIISLNLQLVERKSCYNHTTALTGWSGFQLLQATKKNQDSFWLFGNKITINVQIIYVNISQDVKHIANRSRFIPCTV